MGVFVWFGFVVGVGGGGGGGTKGGPVSVFTLRALFSAFSVFDDSRWKLNGALSCGDPGHYRILLHLNGNTHKHIHTHTQRDARCLILRIRLTSQVTDLYEKHV